MRAKGQLADLAQRAQNASPLEWEMITRNFKELSMNIEQIRHALEELAKVRKRGGIRSRGIDKNIGEQGVAEGSEDRCPQCGMKGCTCSPGKCKCKPIAGWIPNKGFKKAMESGVRVNNCVPVNEDVQDIMDSLINKIIMNEAILHNKR